LKQNYQKSHLFFLKKKCQILNKIKNEKPRIAGVAGNPLHNLRVVTPPLEHLGLGGTLSYLRLAAGREIIIPQNKSLSNKKNDYSIGALNCLCWHVHMSGYWRASTNSCDGVQT
jgi:hypothetical protein